MAPDNAYPIPTDECFAVTKHVIENAPTYNADISRLVLAGDSAGGNAATVVAQRLLKEHLQIPKIQVLIYPWTQKIHSKLPS